MIAFRGAQPSETRGGVAGRNRPAGMGSARQAVSSPGWSEGRAKRLPHTLFLLAQVASCRSSGTGNFPEEKRLAKQIWSTKSPGIRCNRQNKERHSNYGERAADLCDVLLSAASDVSS